MKQADHIYSKSFSSGSRRYFFDIKTTRSGDKYIKISEVRYAQQEGKEHFRIMVFENDIPKFYDSIQSIFKKIAVLEEATKNRLNREQLKNAYCRWTKEDDSRLETLFCEGSTVKDLVNIFKRNPGAINSRIKKLELVEKYGSNKNQ